MPKVSGELQYVVDSFLIEKLAKLDMAMTKEAGLSSDLFSGVGSAVGSFVQSNIDNSSPGALIKSVLKLLEPAMFFKAHWMLGVLSTIANSMFGISVTDIVSNIVRDIIPKIMRGETISPAEVNQAGASLGATASLSFFHDLEKNGQLLKSARTPNQPIGGSTFFPPKGAGLLYKLFGNLANRKSRGAKGLIVGFIVWFIKTILLSAGLLAVSGAAKNLIIGDDKRAGSQQDETSQVATTQIALKPSGKGQDYHANDNSTEWFVPVINKDIEDTILDWTEEIYPELSGYEDIIIRSPSFRKVVDSFTKQYEKGKDFVAVPIGFNRRVDIVNQFIKEVQSLIPTPVST